MPLVMSDGKVMDLTRPEKQAPGPKKDNAYWAAQRISLKKAGLRHLHRGAPIRCRYEGKKVLCELTVPSLAVITTRTFVLEAKMALSDFVADCLTFYFDEKLPGWAYQVEGVDIANDKGHREHTKHYYSSHFKGSKLRLATHLPMPIYITMRSLSDVWKRPMGDVASEAIIFYFDEHMPGWDLSADIEMPKDDDTK